MALLLLNGIFIKPVNPAVIKFISGRNQQELASFFDKLNEGLRPDESPPVTFINFYHIMNVGLLIQFEENIALWPNNFKAELVQAIRMHLEAQNLTLNNVNILIVQAAHSGFN